MTTEEPVSTETIFKTLTSKGWCFRDHEEDVLGLIETKIAAALEEHGEEKICGSKLYELVESEILNMDLKLIGGKSLPDPSLLKKSSHLQGPKILQLTSLRDTYESSIEASFKSSRQHRRLLRFSLTDGHSEVIAVEYSPLLSIAEEIIPGTKILLDKKITVNSGILCLEPKVFTILGGLVQSLYDEWQMRKKYSGFSRSSLKLSENSDSVGPPPFQRLQIESCSSQFTEQRSLNSSNSYSSSSSKGVAIPTKSGGAPERSYTGKAQVPQIVSTAHRMSDSMTGSTEGDQMAFGIENNDDKPSTLVSRRKEVAEAAPVQNQASAQKLLQKMNQPTTDGRHFRSRNMGPKHRGKSKQEEPTVFTLDEWERRKAGVNPLNKFEAQDLSRDEELARQLQNQLDFEDRHLNMGPTDEAERIRLSMFNFGRAEEGNNGNRGGFRGRGRGRGRRRFG